MAFTSRARVLIADDHVLVAAALCKLLSEDFEIVAIVHDGRTLIEAAAKFLPDVVLVDIGMPVLNGLHAAERIKRQTPNIKVICVTVASEPEMIAESFRLGLDGYVIKTCAATELVIAIRLALDGKRYFPCSRAQGEPSANVTAASASMSLGGLTDRQLDILQLLAEGRSMKEVAGVLNLTTRTVAFHKYRAMRRLNLRNDSEVVQYAVQHHMVATDNR